MHHNNLFSSRVAWFTDHLALISTYQATCTLEDNAYIALSHQDVDLWCDVDPLTATC